MKEIKVSLMLYIHINCMYIESPSFVRRKILNLEPSTDRTNNQPYQYGQQRDKLVQHVYAALTDHEKDDQVLRRFRKEAQLNKKKRFQGKRKFQNLSAITQPKHHSFSSAIHNHSVDLTEKIIENTQNQRSLHKQTIQYPPQSNVLLKHSNDLVQKYRKMLQIKERELIKREKKLESSVKAMKRMSRRIEELEKDKGGVQREEQLQISRIEVTLKQLGSQIAQNTSLANRQLSSIRQQFKSVHCQQLPTVQPQSPHIFPAIQSTQNVSRNQKEHLLFRKPTKQQLQGIKKKAQSCKHSKPRQFKERRSPSVLYTNLPTQVSIVLESPSQRNYLDRLNKSILKESRLKGLSESKK